MPLKFLFVNIVLQYYNPNICHFLFHGASRPFTFEHQKSSTLKVCGNLTKNQVDLLVCITIYIRKSIFVI